MIVGVASVMTSIPKAWRPAPHGWSPDAWAMIQRRAAALGLRVKIGCHTFRATGITAYLPAVARWKKRRPWWRMKARVTTNSMIAPATRSRSMKPNGSRFDRAGNSVVRSQDVTRLRFAPGPCGGYIIFLAKKTRRELTGNT
jgi:hypothetical protein